MKVVFHPDVQKDVSKILRYYDGINDRLGDEFWNELNLLINAAAATPHRFHPDENHGRRANLKRFPYHFLFREISDGIRITVVRHHRQHADYGSHRR
ncbi:MAG TPA: type II toxin-antitoxin system RelE/ParE family toxin [Verrucomicrobiae bacterium]|nr:type II toxin-antitoxin system RelE/ParE family toxin [Verrucomicrobiae bacterium]